MDSRTEKINKLVSSAYKVDHTLTPKSRSQITCLALQLLAAARYKADAPVTRENVLILIENYFWLHHVTPERAQKFLTRWRAEADCGAPDLSEAALVIRSAIDTIYHNRDLANGIMFNILQAKPQTLWDLLCVFPFALK